MHWAVPVAGLCVLAAVASLALTLMFRPAPEPERSATDVPLGVEEAVIVRYSGPRLAARPYRRGASVNVRIANEAQKGATRIYDVRYVINLPGEFDLTEYLTSTDGTPLDDLPAFKVRGLTSLTKDIETRIREIENVGIHVWHWYDETLVGLGIFWVAWLFGLVFIGRAKRPPAAEPPPPEPSVYEQIEAHLGTMRDRELSVPEKTRLEALLILYWREQLGLDRHRMAPSCRRIGQSEELGRAYRTLEAWLHDPRSGVEAADFLGACRPRAGNGVSPRRGAAGR